LEDLPLPARRDPQPRARDQAMERSQTPPPDRHRATPTWADLDHRPSRWQSDRCKSVTSPNGPWAAPPAEPENWTSSVDRSSSRDLRGRPYGAAGGTGPVIARTASCGS